MKKLFLIALPIFICIAVLFSLQDRLFDLNVFLNVISEWDFEDSLQGFVLVRDTLEEIGEIFESFDNVNGIFDAISKVGDLIATYFKGVGQLLLSIGGVVVEFVDNVITIVTYLFNWTYNGSSGGGHLGGGDF